MNNQPRNLIFLWNYLEWGGAQIYFLAIIKRAKKNWKIRVFLPEGSAPDILDFIRETGVEYELTNVRLDSSPAATVRKKIKRQWRRIHAEFSSLLTVWKYRRQETVIHVETAPWQSWIFLSALTLCGNVFVTVHNALTKTSGWRETVWKARLKFLSKLKRFHLLTANREAKESLKSLMQNNFAEHIPVTYASIDPLETKAILKWDGDRTETFERLSIPNGRFTVLCAGQFIDRKGRWIYLEAAEKVLKKSVDIQFVWLMPHLPDAHTRKKINQYQLNNNFSTVCSADAGRKRTDILRFISFADLFVLPSLLEGLPISLLEAMALKKACIASNINAIPEAVGHLETGWLIEPGNADALAEAVLTLKNDDDLRNKLSEQGQTFVVKNFDERKMADLAISEYEQSFN